MKSKPKKVPDQHQEILYNKMQRLTQETLFFKKKDVPKNKPKGHMKKNKLMLLGTEIDFVIPNFWHLNCQTKIHRHCNQK